MTSAAAVSAIAVVVGAALVASGCANDGPGADVERARGAVVVIESQRCENPNRAHGVGVVAGENLIVTAGHIVEGDLRDLTVDGQPAVVAAIDRNTDLAVLMTALPGSIEPPAFSAVQPADLLLLGPGSGTDIRVTGRETLVIEHASDRATYRREVIAFTPGVSEGMSGSPIVDRHGRLAGIVILGDDATGEGIAITGDEVAGLLDTLDPATTEPAPIGSC